MTVICAVRDGNAVWIGADSRMVSHHYVYPVPVKKWNEIDGWWIAFSGNWRFDALLKLHRPKLEGSPDEVAETLRRLIITDDWKPVREEEPGPKRHDLQGLAVSPDAHVYEIGMAGVAIEAGNEFVAVGSGCEYAQGAAHALQDATPERRVNAALVAACKYEASCGPPLFVKKLGGVASVGELAERHRLVPRFSGPQDGAIAAPVGSEAWHAEGTRFLAVQGTID